MTVQSEVSQVSYNGNGVTTIFATSFAFINQTDVKVILVSSTGVETLLTLNTHYSLTGGNGESGNVVMNTAPANGQRLFIYRQPALLQNFDFVENDSFPAESFEKALDLLIHIAQYLDRKSDRALLLPVSSTASVDIPSPEADKVLAWSGDATRLINLAVVAGALLGNQDIVGWLRASQYLASRSPNGTKQAVLRCENNRLVLEYQNQDGTVVLPFRFPTVAGGIRTTLLNDGNGNLFFDNPFRPAFYATRTTTQNIGNATITKIQCNIERIDSDGYYDNLTNFRFTPLIPGWYQVTMSADFVDAGTAAQGGVLYLYKNGVSDFVVSDAQYDNGNAGLAGTTMVYLNGSTDYIELFGLIGGTGANTIANPRFSAVFMGNFPNQNP